MAATRFLLAPLSGVFVATSLLYTFRHTMAVRTHDTALALNDIKLKLNDVDPDNWDKYGRERVTREQLRPAYVAPSRPTVVQEIQSRWNVSTAPIMRLSGHASDAPLAQEHLSGAVQTVSNADYYDLAANGYASLKSIVTKATGSMTGSSSNSAMGVPLEAQTAATGGIKSGIVNTQGVSIREDQFAGKDISRGPGSSVGSRVAQATGIEAGKVEGVMQGKPDIGGFGSMSDGNAGKTYYAGDGTSLR